MVIIYQHPLKMAGFEPTHWPGLTARWPPCPSSTDSRYKAFLKEHPDIKGTYEFDAMDPDALQRLTEKAIDDWCDPSLLPRAGMKEWQERF